MKVHLMPDEQQPPNSALDVKLDYIQRDVKDIMIFCFAGEGKRLYGHMQRFGMDIA